MKYSQNALNTYKSCPVKYKTKYIDKIYWKKENDTDYLEKGTYFHLLCERFFLGINTTIESDHEFYNAFLNVQNKFNLDDYDFILPEYEINYKNFNAKFDLVLIKGDLIEIWDFKTKVKNNKRLSPNYKDRMQTIIYLFLGYEVIPKLFDLKIDYSNISINFFEVDDNKLYTIKHSKMKHLEYKKNIFNLVANIEQEKFYNINEKHCKYCEFENICNK
ncbi:MAG: PD-(D/E)XK nuclease family protein [Peptostreptococcaceae bacterium]